MKDFFNGMCFVFYLTALLANVFGSFEIAGFDFGDTLIKKIGFSILFGACALTLLYGSIIRNR